MIKKNSQEVALALFRVRKSGFTQKTRVEKYDLRIAFDKIKFSKR
jgi:hypothetical protein